MFRSTIRHREMVRSAQLRSTARSRGTESQTTQSRPGDVQSVLGFEDSRIVADGSVQELNGMRRGHLRAAVSQHHLDLKGAAGIGAREKLRLNREEIVHFSCSDFPGGIGLEQIVDPRAAAAL